MAAVNGGETYHDWLAKINQVCGHFAARPLEGDFHGEIDTSYAGSLKLSTVTTRNVNLYRTHQEIRGGNDAWFYTVFQLSGEASIEQDDRQVCLQSGDMTLIDASRPCSNLASGLAVAASPTAGKPAARQRNSRRHPSG